MRIKDNDKIGKYVEEKYISDFKSIANKKICDLVAEDNANLLIFPNTLSKNKNDISEEHIFNLYDTILTTGNIMGFVGVNGSEITIESRFAQEDKSEGLNKDYFLHYMLQKVFSINLFDFKHGMKNESIFDFLLYLFSYYLKKALRQGLYKEYYQKEYNDCSVKGSIDFNRHIKKNIPFMANVAYNVREHSYDNKVTQLIRHTIEYIKQSELGQGILSNDSETINCVTQIIKATPSYEHNDRIATINRNIRPFSHPYYFEYKALKKICMQILKHEGLKYGKNDDKVYGLLFDGAWLWEEYLYTFLNKCGFTHSRNIEKENPIYLFKNPDSYDRYPDFWKDDFILDAKYKWLEYRIDRNDMHQIISYMHVKNAHIGGFIAPSNKVVGTEKTLIGHLKGFGGEVNKWMLYIPKSNKSFEEFCRQIGDNEKKMVEIIREQKF